MCRCGEVFFGQCIRAAGCQTHMEVSPILKQDIYLKQCIDLILKYDCPNPSVMCAVNCATDGSINPDTSLIIPFNNYGQYFLRIRLCNRKVHSKTLQRYSTVDTGNSRILVILILPQLAIVVHKHIVKSISTKAMYLHYRFIDFFFLQYRAAS